MIIILYKRKKSNFSSKNTNYSWNKKSNNINYIKNKTNR